MNPKLIFFLMVLIIALLWGLQKMLAGKNEEYSKLERAYIEGLKKFKNDELTKDQLIEISLSYFKANGLNEDQSKISLDRDIENYG